MTNPAIKAAEAMREAAARVVETMRDDAQRQCCGLGVAVGDHAECCGDTDYMITIREAALNIRALLLPDDYHYACLEREFDAAQARIAELERQRDDLQAANNAYLERARKAEAENKVLLGERGGAITHCHVKRGTFYRFVSSGRAQVDGCIEDMQGVVIYRGVTDGSYWVRPVSEFFDGRFVLIGEGEGAA